LRREEVAMLAGISVEYYLRLEQGRDRAPSHQVLDALARTLSLNDEQSAYLRKITQPGVRQTGGPRQEVPAGMLRLLDALTMPAYVQNRYTDVLAANTPARALSPSMAPGANRLRSALLDPRERALHADWEDATAEAIGQLRAAAGADSGDPRLAELVAELSIESEHFRRLWSRHDVARRAGGPALLHHPRVGDLELDREKLHIAGTDDQMLVVYHAEPGSASSRVLAALAGLGSVW
jgi:transcriptional regulator with XRE-family HTH domain